MERGKFLFLAMSHLKKKAFFSAEQLIKKNSSGNKLNNQIFYSVPAKNVISDSFGYQNISDH